LSVTTVAKLVTQAAVAAIKAETREM